MGLFGYAAHKLGLGEHHKGNVPLNLHPGTRIEIQETPLIFADAAGSIVKDIKRSDVITTLGYYQQGDMIVYRAYFDDDNCFIEVPVKETAPETPVHIRVFKTMNEDFMSPELKNFLLGDEPAIGWFQFKFEKTQTIYDRSWVAGENVPNSVQPFSLVESLMDSSKKVVQHDEHQIMLYQRDLPNNLTEYLYTDFVDQKRPDGQEAEAFRTFVGIDISQNDVNIYPST